MEMNQYNFLVLSEVHIEQTSLRTCNLTLLISQLHSYFCNTFLKSQDTHLQQTL